jgi:hypothetical protein
MSAVAQHQLDDASAQVNIVARVGGALGSALLVVILTNRLPSPGTGTAASTASAFHTTFWWLTCASLFALVGTGWLIAAQRRATTYDATRAETVTMKEADS